MVVMQAVDDNTNAINNCDKEHIVSEARLLSDTGWKLMLNQIFSFDHSISL